MMAACLRAFSLLTLYNGYDYLPMLGFKLNHVSKRYWTKPSKVWAVWLISGMFSYLFNFDKKSNFSQL